MGGIRLGVPSPGRALGQQEPLRTEPSTRQRGDLGQLQWGWG